jgi:hypothetical protein
MLIIAPQYIASYPINDPKIAILTNLLVKTICFAHQKREKSRKMKLFHKNSWRGCVNPLSLHSQIRNNAAEAPEKAKCSLNFWRKQKTKTFVLRKSSEANFLTKQKTKTSREI